MDDNKIDEKITETSTDDTNTPISTTNPTLPISNSTTPIIKPTANNSTFKLKIILLLVVLAISVIAAIFLTLKPAVLTGNGSKHTGWLTYKSTNSTVSFQYPPDWTLTSIRDISNKYELEHLSISAVSNFKIDYYLGKSEPPFTGGLTYFCITPPSYWDAEDLPEKYRIHVQYRKAYVGETPEQSSAEGAYGLQLFNYENPKPGHGMSGKNLCFKEYYISLPNDSYAQLSASFIYGRGVDFAPYSVAKYLKLPEVKTAIEIFKTFTQ